MPNYIASTVSVPMYQLIGAPLQALIQAEALAAQASAEFIETVGFVKDENTPEGSFGKVKTVTFTYKKQNVNGAIETAELTLPVLSLIPIPLLHIQDATLEFNMQLSEEETFEGDNTEAVGNEVNEPVFSPQTTYLQDNSVSYKGTFVPQNADISQKIDLKIKINVAQADVPVGLAKLFQAMDLAVMSGKPASVPIDPDPQGENNGNPPTA